jgi:hypothetical protein
MGLIIRINGYTTETPSPTSFMGYPVEYYNSDTYSCITTTTIIPDDTSKLGSKSLTHFVFLCFLMKRKKTRGMFSVTYVARGKAYTNH